MWEGGEIPCTSTGVDNPPIVSIKSWLILQKTQIFQKPKQIAFFKEICQS